MMLVIALLFLLVLVFPIGWRVGAGVQDEVIPAFRYLEFGAALAVVLFAFVTLREITSMPITLLLCAVCAVLLVLTKKAHWLPAAVSGALAGLAVVTPPALVLCVLANYLLGMLAKEKELIRLCASFVSAAVACLLLY
jgi:hypothetical protein